MSVDILGTSWDQCVSMVQYSFTFTETRRLVRTDSPGRPPRLSHSSWTIARVVNHAPRWPLSVEFIQSKFNHGWNVEGQANFRWSGDISKAWCHVESVLNMFGEKNKLLTPWTIIHEKKSDNKLKTNLGTKKKKPRKPTDFKTTNILIDHARNNSEL